MSSYVAVAFAISWAIWAPLVWGAADLSGSVAWVIYFSGVIGPPAAALLCASSGSPARLGEVVLLATSLLTALFVAVAWSREKRTVSL